MNDLFWFLGMLALGLFVGFSATYLLMNERKLYEKLINLEKIEYRYEAELDNCENRASKYFHNSTGCNFEKERVEEGYEDRLLYESTQAL